MAGRAGESPISATDERWLTYNGVRLRVLGAHALRRYCDRLRTCWTVRLEVPHDAANVAELRRRLGETGHILRGVGDEPERVLSLCYQNVVAGSGRMEWMFWSVPLSADEVAREAIREIAGLPS